MVLVVMHLTSGGIFTLLLQHLNRSLKCYQLSTLLRHDEPMAPAGTAHAYTDHLACYTEDELQYAV